MRLGLRAKTALALFACMSVVLALAIVAGRRALHAIEENLGSAFARNATQLNRQRILTPVLRELALSQRLADSEVTRRWLLDENNATAKALFFAEAEGYRRAFDDKSYFVISRASRNYFFNDARSRFSDKPRYQLSETAPTDAWFFSTMKNTRDFNINVDPDVKLKVTKVWFNVMVKHRGRNIGLAGTGLDLTTFLNRFITAQETGVTPMILNAQGFIQAHPDRRLIDYASINDKGAAHSTIYRLLPDAGGQNAMREALRRAQSDHTQIPVFTANFNGRAQLFAVSFIPELKWFAVTAVDTQAAQVLNSQIWLPVVLAGGALLLLLVLIIVLAVNRLLLSPVLALTRSAQAISAGNYLTQLPPAGYDEIGELTRAFGTMAEEVRAHTENLETKIRARTQELLALNEQMAQANQKIGDSIQYASLIQNAILPDRELSRALQDHHFVLWSPRDVVGGDFYVCHTTEEGCLLGVVDCAGHGVPGALMTMLAHSALNVAIDHLGPRDPAALLAQVDGRVRAMLHAEQTAQSESQSEVAGQALRESLCVATHMDAGLAYVDFRERRVTFCGAKVSLYWCDGETTGELKGDRVAIGGKRVPIFNNQSTPLDPRQTFYLTTDGLLDQAGGPKGFSFGQARFAELLKRHAKRPLDEQKRAFAEELATYQGELPQRDDITVLSFRFGA